MISIVIPSYNQAQFLPDAIESVLNQRRGLANRTTKYELIIVDDGSTDGSLEIAQRYISKEIYRMPVKVISQVNKGLASARNTGIMNSIGGYILFLDADDILMENALCVIQRYINDYGTDIVAPSFKCFGGSNESVVLKPNPTIEDQKVANHIGYCAAVKRSVLLECGGYSPKMTWGFEDYHLWFDLLGRGKTIVTIPISLWFYRVKENSMIHVANAHKEELMTQIKKDFPKIYA